MDYLYSGKRRAFLTDLFDRRLQSVLVATTFLSGCDRLFCFFHQRQHAAHGPRGTAAAVGNSSKWELLSDTRYTADTWPPIQTGRVPEERATSDSTELCILEAPF